MTLKTSDLNTEQVILNAAEAEFFEKGYGSAQMMSIAQKAGVSHSMLHYYFRSKENLFQTVFLNKVQTVSLFFEDIFEQQLPFAETIRRLVETQFDFVAQNPKLPHFILNEIVSNKDNRDLLFEVVAPKAAGIAAKMQKLLAEEMAKGAIRPISVRDFAMNVVSLNISTFIALPMLQDILKGKNGAFIEDILKERRESNVQFILNALRP